MFKYNDHMSEMNADGFHSLLEERIAHVLRGYGAEVQPGPKGSGVDLVMRIPTAEGRRHLTVDVKATHRLGVPHQRRKSDVAGHDYVSPSLAANYRDREMFYVDVLGNAYIVLPGFRVDVQGRKPPKTQELTQLKPHKAFGVAGAKLVFALLVRPEAVNWTVRDLANLARISTGTVNNTIHDLGTNGFLLTNLGSRRLRRTDRLTQLWLSSYLTRISPKLEEVSLAGPDPRWWLSTQRPTNAVLGGGVAMSAMGLDILPATSLVYGAPPWRGVRKAGRLGRDGTLNVTLREQFWDPQLNPAPHLAPPLLVYADAIASDDPRQMEAAAELWEKNDDLRRLRALD